MSLLPIKQMRRTLLLTTVRLDAKGKAQGTGFGVYLDVAGSYHPYIVTCRHVVQPKEQRLELELLLRCEDEKGEIFIPVTVDPNGWVFPEEADLAFLAIGNMFNDLRARGLEPLLAPLPLQAVPSSKEWADFEVLEEVAFVGYPNGLYDRESMLPLVRRGVTATLPSASWQEEPAFLIDASVFPGSSGSPVVMLNDIWSGSEGLSFGSRFYLLGTLCRTLPADRNERIDLGLVTKSTILKEHIQRHVSGT